MAVHSGVACSNVLNASYPVTAPQVLSIKCPSLFRFPHPRLPASFILVRVALRHLVIANISVSICSGCLSSSHSTIISLPSLLFPIISLSPPLPSLPFLPSSPSSLPPPSPPSFPSPSPPPSPPHSDALDGHLLALADEDGSLVLRDCRVPLTHTSSWLVGIRAFKNAIFDLAWVPGENKLVSVCAHATLQCLACALRAWVVGLLSWTLSETHLVAFHFSPCASTVFGHCSHWVLLCVW